MQFNPFDLSGKTILVTGASSGIGRGIAVNCSKMNAKIIIIGRNSDKLRQTFCQLEGEGHVMEICDITSSSDITRLVEKLPLLDGVVHCAGVGQRILGKFLKDEDINSVMDVNFKAPVILQAELLRKKKIKNSSSIVFIASIATWSPSMGNSVYSASKGALVSYANCLSLELAPRKIRVNCISPAMVWTDLIMQDNIDHEQLKEDENKYPLKRYGQPDDIAYLTIYMLSDASSWMTGSDVKLSGGGKLS